MGKSESGGGKRESRGKITHLEEEHSKDEVEERKVEDICLSFMSAASATLL